MHSFDRFYVVTKFMLPLLEDLKFSDINYDKTCTYLDNRKAQNTETQKYILDLKMSCRKIEPFVTYYKRLIKSYNNTAHIILIKEINLLLPKMPRVQKCGIFTNLCVVS